MTAGAASGNNRERRLAQSKGNPRRPNARIFCEYKADATFLSRAFCGQNAYVSDQREEHTKSHSIRPATPQSEPSQRSNHSPGFGSGLYHRGATRTDRVGRHPAVPERNTPSRSSPSPVPCFAPQFRPSSGLQLRPPAPSGLRPDPSWDPTREPTAAGESRFSPRCSRSGRCCPAARGAAAWHARG